MVACMATLAMSNGFLTLRLPALLGLTFQADDTMQRIIHLRPRVLPLSIQATGCLGRKVTGSGREGLDFPTSISDSLLRC